MKNLKDDYTLVKWDSVNEEKVWFEEDLQEANQEFIKILDMYKDDIGRHNKKRLMNEFKRIYGEWTNDTSNK